MNGGFASSNRRHTDRWKLAVLFHLGQDVAVSTAVESILQQVNGLSPDEQKEFWDRLMAEDSTNGRTKSRGIRVPVSSIIFLRNWMKIVRRDA